MRDLKEREIRLDFELKEEVKLNAEIKEHEKEISSLQQQLQINETQNATLPESIRNVELKLNEHQQRATEKEDVFVGMVQKITESINQIKTIMNDIHR
jgi:septal ring factor EnvC (AmiA/AmiB activator)